jgi:hypothetical protein
MSSIPMKTGREGQSQDIYTEKSCTIDFSAYSGEREISVVIQQDLPMDGLFGLFDPADEGSFTVKTIGETYYTVFLKNCGQSFLEGSEESYAAKQIERLNFHIGNYIINFKQTPAYGFYVYNIIHSIPVIAIESGGVQKVGAGSSYSFMQIDLNTEKMSEAEFWTLLGTNSLVLTLKDQAGSLLNKSLIKSDIEAAWNNGEPMAKISLSRNSEQISFQALVNDTAVEAVECRIFPADQSIKLDEVYNRLRRKPIVFNLTKNTGEVVAKAEHGKNEERLNSITYSAALEQKSYNLTLALTEEFGSLIKAKLFLKLYAQLEGVYSYEDFIEKAAALSLVLEDSQSGAVQQFTVNARPLFEGGSNLETINITRPIQSLKASYSFNNFKAVSEAEVSKRIWLYVHSDFGRILAAALDQQLQLLDAYTQSFGFLKETFGRHYYFLLSFSAVYLNIVGKYFAGNLTEGRNLALLMGNLDILGSRNSTFWIDKSLLSPDGAEEDSETFFSAIKTDLENLVSYCNTNSLSAQDLFSMAADGTLKKAAEEQNPMQKLIDTLSEKLGLITVTEQEAGEMFDALSGFQDYAEKLIKEDSSQSLISLIDELTARLRQYVLYEKIASEESLLGGFDLYFSPAERDAENFRTDFNFQSLEVIPRKISGTKKFYRLYNCITENVVLHDKAKKSWTINLMELPKGDIKEFVLSNKIIFSSEKEPVSGSVDISFYDNNLNLIKAAEAAYKAEPYTGKEVQIFTGLKLNDPTDGAEETTYCLSFDIEGASGFTDNKTNFITVKYPAPLEEALNMVFYDSLLYYNKNEEPIEGTRFVYEKSIPAAFAADKDATAGKYVSYLSIPCSFTQLAGTVSLHYDIRLPQALADSFMVLSLYSSSGAVVKDFAVTALRGNIDINSDLLTQDIYEVVFMIFTESKQLAAAESLPGISMYLLAHKALLTYIPSITGNQIYATAPYRSNVILVQEGSTLIYSDPGYNNFILGRYSDTTVELTEPSAPLNNISLELLDADIQSLTFTQTDDKKDLVLGWGYVAEEKAAKQSLFNKRLQTLFSSGQSPRQARRSSTLTLKNYFVSFTASGLTFTVGKISYILENNSDTFYLRQIVRFDMLEEGEEPEFSEYNYIVRRPGELAEPSPAGSDIVVGGTDHINSFVNSASGKNTHLIGGADINIFNIINKGNCHISANGADNTINISSVYGQKILDINAKENSTTTINIDTESIDNCFISGRNVIFTREILPKGFFINCLPETADTTDELLPACQTSLASNEEANFFIRFETETMISGRTVIFSTLSVNADNQRRGMEIIAAPENGGTITYSLTYIDESEAISEVRSAVSSLPYGNVHYIGAAVNETDVELIIFNSEGAVLGRDKKTAAAAAVGICYDKTATVNYSRSDKPESASAEKFILRFIYQRAEAFSDEQYSELIALDRQDTADEGQGVDSDLLSSLGILDAGFPDGGRYNTVFILNAVQASPILAEKITVRFVEGLFTLNQLIKYIRINSALLEALTAESKDFKEPDEQRNLSNLINIGYAPVIDFTDRLGDASFYTNEENK